jgi:hypothetical protein
LRRKKKDLKKKIDTAEEVEDSKWSILGEAADALLE